MTRLTQADALAQLSLQCQATIYPLLTTDELITILQQHAIATVWTPNTAYAVGDVVYPAEPNGHIYRAVKSGTSGATSPIWPLYTNPTGSTGITTPYWYSATWGANAADNDVIWVEAGVDSGVDWDIRAATYAAWIAKAGKASSDYDGSMDRDTFKRSQVVDNCLKLARSYIPQRLV